MTALMTLLVPALGLWSELHIPLQCWRPPSNEKGLFMLKALCVFNYLLMLSHKVKHSRGWTSCIFNFVSELIAKTQNPSAPDLCFEELTISLQGDFTDWATDDMLLCPVRYNKCHLNRREQYCLNCSDLYLYIFFFFQCVVRRRKSARTLSLSGSESSPTMLSTKLIRQPLKKLHCGWSKGTWDPEY